MSTPREQLDLLQAVRARIAKPEHWTQGTCARYANGAITDPVSPDAVCWCLLGAALAERPDGYDGSTVRMMYEALCLTEPIGSVNDGSTHAEVLELLDKHIRRLSDELA